MPLGTESQQKEAKATEVQKAKQPTEKRHLKVKLAHQEAVTLRCTLALQAWDCQKGSKSVEQRDTEKELCKEASLFRALTEKTQ